MRQIAKIGVIGAGNMGSGIAQKIAQEGIPVVMIDTARPMRRTGHGQYPQTLLSQGVERKLFRPGQADEILGRITHRYGLFHRWPMPTW